MSYTALQVDQRFHEEIGDWIEEDTTTNITTNNSVISTALNNWDSGNDDAFNTFYWCYLTEGNNAGADRQITDYATATGTLTLRGAALSADSSATTFRLYRFSYTDTRKVINEAIRNLFPSLHKHEEDHTLITQNILPNSHFEDWASASYPDNYNLSSATSAATTTAGLYRGGTKSAKVTASAANGYMYISSNTYPRLLDLMGKTVNFKSWAYPEVADDAKIEIYTIKADGTAQTLTSTTACPAGKMSLLELEDQSINDDITEIQFRWKVATNTKYVYFDNSRANGRDIDELLLPTKFVDGIIDRVLIQGDGNSDDWCDDLEPSTWIPVYGWTIVNDGTNQFLKLPLRYSKDLQIRIIGRSPFDTFSSDAGTIDIEDRELNLLVAYAKYKLFKRTKTPISAEDINRYRIAEAEAYSDYLRLLIKFRMPIPPSELKIMSVY